jgi:hypothetical protein
MLLFARAQLEQSVARYLALLDTADRQEPADELAAKTAHLKEKLAKLESEMQRLAAMERLMLASPDQQISLTDPDSRSMATSWTRLRLGPSAGDEFPDSACPKAPTNDDTFGVLPFF